MKRLVAALVILAAIIGDGIAEAVYVDGPFGELEERIAALATAIKDPGDGALDAVRGLNAWWEDERGSLDVFTWSPDMRAFSVALAETEGSLECGDDKNALSKCQSLLTMAENLRDLLDFNAADII